MKIAVAVLAAVVLLAGGCSRKSEAAPARALAPPAKVVETGDQLCRGALKTFVTFKDPESVRVNSVSPNEQRPGRFLMSVSAKNSYGGYGDPTMCTCGTANGAVTDMHCDGTSGD